MSLLLERYEEESASTELSVEYVSKAQNTSPTHRWIVSRFVF